MSTSTHCLKISLSRWQVRFLTERARRDGVSVAEVIRRMVEREAEASQTQGDAEALWEIAGLAQDSGELFQGMAVSERPELYLGAAENS